MLDTIILRLLEQLLAQELLLLTTDSNIQELALDIVREMPKAQFGSHFGSWFSQTLIGHPSVEELFATDAQLTNMLRYIQS